MTFFFTKICKMCFKIESTENLPEVVCYFLLTAMEAY